MHTNICIPYIYIRVMVVWVVVYIHISIYLCNIYTVIYALLYTYVAVVNQDPVYKYILVYIIQ